MKVIFLDFDGVLNSQASFLYEDRKRRKLRKDRRNALCPVNETLCHVCCSNFQYILDKVPDAKVVISSSWRGLFELDWLKDKLESYGIDSSRVIDITPTKLSSTRGEEIRMWLSNHPDVKEFIIIDDCYIGNGFDEEIVRTSWSAGLTLERALEAIQLLGVKLPEINRDLYA